MTPPEHSLANDALHKFLLIHRHLRQYARHIDAQGIRPRQLAVLRFLQEKQTATIGDIQAYLYTSLGSASTLVSQLEEAGYVTRTRSQNDNRVVNVRLTPAGAMLAENTPPGGIALLRRGLDTLPDDRLRLIDEALAEIMRLMEVTDLE